MKTLLVKNAYYNLAAGFIWSIIVCLVCCFQINSSAQCDSAAASVFGDPFIEERGRCILKSVFSEAIYVAGNRNDSTLLIKIDFKGRILWAKTIDVVPGVYEVPAGLVEDDEGMLAIVGTAGSYNLGGTLYAIRYDPNANTILWAHEYVQSPNEYSCGMIEKGPGGNYLLNNQATFYSLNHNYASVTEIDRNTGLPVSEFAKNYKIIGTETIFELNYHDGSLFGIARYKDGGTNDKMRNTLVKLDPSNGDQIWVKMGHRSQSMEARLYGSDLIVENNSIYSLYSGDPDGMSTTNTKLYIQRTDLEGNLNWINQYELPGNADQPTDMVAADGGIVVLCYENNTKTQYLFKIDLEGNLIWTKTFEFEGVLKGTLPERSNPLLILAGDQLIFTGYVINATGDEDLIVVRTDLEGNVVSPCVNSKTVIIESIPVVDPIWYDKIPEQISVELESSPIVSQVEEIALPVNMQCAMPYTLFTQIDTTICQGMSFESYTESGIYVDTFLTEFGCDSVRELEILIIPNVEIFESVEICAGQQFEQYSIAGTYLDTFPGSLGTCDTIRNLTLSVIPTIESNVQETICEGQQYLGYNTTGVYMDTLISHLGCDSIRTLHLLVEENIEFQVVASVCAGQQFEQYNIAGTYLDTFPGSLGTCDTIRNLTLSFIPAKEINVQETICEGQQYLGYNATGVYTDTLISHLGCDSIRTLQLLVEENIEFQIMASVCDGLQYGYATVGTYIDTFISNLGCDSIRTLVLNGASLYIPNIFSPNDDGINDEFVVIQFPEEHLDFHYFAIYDRFGDMAYETTTWPVIWTGVDKNGRKFQPGVFAYIFIYQCSNQRQIEHGTITLVK